VRAAARVLLPAAAAVLVACDAGSRETATPAGAGAAGAGPPVRVAAPAPYRVPRRALRVSTARQLHTALERPRSRAIVLRPGVYDSSGPFLNPHGHRLYAARLGRAVLRAGVSLGGNAGRGGGLVRGLVIDVADRARTVAGAGIAVWGSGRGSRILDTTVRGHGVLEAGIGGREPDGLVVRRVVVRDTTDFGLFADANQGESAPRGRFSISDLDVAGVARPQPGSSDGRAEACLWVGHRGSVRRVRVRSCAWAGVWTGSAARRVRITGADIDGTRTGLYLEHFTTDSRFARLRIGPRVRDGVLAEWASPAWEGRPASVRNVIERCRIESREAGVYLDEGTTETTVRHCVFVGQSWGAIGDYRGVGNRFAANDYRRIDDGAQAVRRDHLGSSRGG
jgi:hypothetical protein